MSSKALRLQAIYDRLSNHFGPTGWWPGDSPFEIAVGAVLTQNTAWTNVEKAIANLKREKLLSARKILECPQQRLETTLKPSGYFRIKAKRLRNFCAYLVDRHGGSMRRMTKRPLEELRQELLGVNGIGPETADDILLYACELPVFVIDAYTRRILSRHGVADHDLGYETLRELFEKNLPSDVELFKDYHGLIVYTGKDFCKSKPQCEGCPLQPLLNGRKPKIA